MTDYIRDFRLAEWGPTVILRGNNRQDRMSALGQKQTSEWSAPLGLDSFMRGFDSLPSVVVLELCWT